MSELLLVPQIISGDHDHIFAVFTEFIIVFNKATLWFFVAVRSVQQRLSCRLLQETCFLFVAVSCVQSVCVVLIVLWCYCEVHGRSSVFCAPLWSSILQTQC